MNKKNSKNTKLQDNKLIWATIALVVVVIASCLALAFINTSNNNESTKYETYQNVNSDEVFALLDETDEISNLYVGRDTCPHCSAFAPKLIEVIKEENVLVYYYDTALARTDDVDKLNELMEILDVSGVPALMKIENGEVLTRLNEYDNKEAITNFLKQ